MPGLWRKPGAAAASPLLWAVHGAANVNYIATDHPNAEEPLNNQNGRGATRLDATGFTQVRLSTSVNTASASPNNPRMYLQYTATLSGTAGWTVVGTGTGAEALSLATAAPYVSSDWTTLPAGARGDVLFRIVQNGGDGALDPAIKHLQVEFR